MAAMLAFGVLGQVSVIVAGPSTGLLAVGKAGYLPHFLQKTNRQGIPTNILPLQKHDHGVGTGARISSIRQRGHQCRYRILGGRPQQFILFRAADRCQRWVLSDCSPSLGIFCEANRKFRRLWDAN
jgi:hypothetical protein